jgi:hypothetical protein
MSEHKEFEMGSGLFELAAAEGPYEEVIIVRSLGTAKIFINGKTLHIVPNGKLHRLTGKRVGWYSGVFKSTVDDPLTVFPPPPSGPYTKPSPIPDFRKRLHPTKAIFKFHDGTIETAGPANSYVIPLKDNTAQLVISIAMVIGKGTGRYAGARGTVSSLGATWFPYIPGQTLAKSLKTGALFEAKGVHGFRITLAKYQAEPASGSSDYEEEGDAIEDADDSSGYDDADQGDSDDQDGEDEC